MSSATSSDNSDNFGSKFQNLANKYKESESSVKHIIMGAEKMFDVQFNKKNFSEMSISSSSSSSDSTSSDSDTESSSDLDEEENNILYKKLLDEAQTIKSHFNYLKKMYFQSRMREVEEKLIEVRLGTAREYRIPLEKLKLQLKSRLDVATALRQFKLTNLKHKYEAGEQAIRQNFENDKEILYDKMKSDLEEKIQRLEEARNEVDIDASLWLGRSLTRSGRGRGRRPYEHVQPKQKQAIVSGPCIVYNLKEHEILEDWTIIKKSLSELKRKEDAEKKYKPYP